MSVDFYGNVSQAYQYANPTGYMDKIVVRNGTDNVTINGYVDVSGYKAGTVNDFKVETSGASFSGAGNFSATVSKDYYGNYSSTVTGNFSSLSLSLGNSSINVSGIQTDIMSISKYALFTDFLADIQAGNDNVTGTNGSEELYGYAGNDYLSAGYGDDALIGGEGNDTLVGGYGNDYYFVDVGDTVIEENDGGIDTIFTSASYLSLPSNVEKLFSVDSKATLYGNSLDNYMRAFAFNTTANDVSFFGQAGNDTLDGGAGNDTIDGGSGIDTAVYSQNKSNYTISKNGSTYTISSVTDGTDTLSNIEYLQFADETVAIDDALPKPITPPPVAAIVTPPAVIETSKTVISTKQTSNNDQLTGTNKHDKLSGLAGDDTLIGGLGADVLTGGSGSDVFQFNDIKETGKTAKTRDTITDFKTSDGDKIDLSGIDANTNRTGDQPFTNLDVGNKFSGKFASTGSLFFETSTQILWRNVDTKAGADFSIKLSGVKTLTLDDFIL
jgi:serralysin